MAVHPPGNRAARRTQTETSGRADRDNGPITIMVSTFDNKPTRHQTGAAKRLLHGADSLGESTTRILNCIKYESEPNLTPHRLPIFGRRSPGLGGQYCRPNDSC